MFQSRIAIHGSGLPNPAVVSSTASLLPGTQAAARNQRLREAAVDETLADSFPASDPPAWNPGVVRPVPVGGALNSLTDHRLPEGDDAATIMPSVIDVSRPKGSERTFLQGLVSLAGAVSLVLLVPFVIMLVGIPIGLAARGLLELVRWLSAALG